jgi:2-keto-3-deoxy-L-rhamnonate aldolase RhmA
MRDLLAARDVCIGHFVNEFATPGIGYIVKAAGFDYVGFDMEHSGLEFETVRAVLRFAEAAGLATMVRPPSKQYSDIARTLDIGADSLMIQMVGTAEEAREIVSYMKYPPKGRRGATIEHYADRFTPGPLASQFSNANEGTALTVLIETAEGVRNVDAIAAVDGVDSINLGHVDLTADLGIPGQYNHPRIVEANEAIAAACRKHGKAFIWCVDSVGTLEEAHRLGANVILYGADASVLRAALAAAGADIRKRLSSHS